MKRLASLGAMARVGPPALPQSGDMCDLCMRIVVYRRECGLGCGRLTAAAPLTALHSSRPSGGSAKPLFSNNLMSGTNGVAVCTRVKFYFTKGGGLPMSSVDFKEGNSLFDSLPCNHGVEILVSSTRESL